MPEFRIEGYLKPLKTERIPRRIIVFDTETTVPDKSKGKGTFDLILGVAIFIELNAKGLVTRRETLIFYSSTEFLDWIDSLIPKRGSVLLLAHNIGFDTQVLDLPSQFNQRGCTSTPPIINERTMIWKVKTQRYGITLLDTSNLGVISVASLGVDLGFPKMEIDFSNYTIDYLITYCTRDVEVLEKFIINYIAYLVDNGLGGFRNTLAGQSMAAYRTKFLESPPYIHINEGALQLEREGYHGGRVECFRIGHFSKEEYYHLDVNSMYPYAMTTEPLPIKFRGYGQDVRLLFMPTRMNLYYCIARCEIETDEPVYPLMANGKLIFPTGRFTTILFHPELRYALERSHIRAVKECAVYDNGYPFNSYVDFFYTAKATYGEQGNSSYRYISKLFLNSLYGKFGQLRPVRNLIGESGYKGVTRLPLVDIETGRHYQEVNWYGQVYREYKEGETAISNPAIAGAITAKGRMHLWTLILKAGRENVLYIDTDALIVTRQGYDNLTQYMDANKLGMLKLENTCRNLHIYGNKDYIEGYEPKRKGINKTAQVVSKATWEYLQFEGFISWLNRGASGSPIGTYTRKQRKSPYNKGIVGDNGMVTPYLLS